MVILDVKEQQDLVRLIKNLDAVTLGGARGRLNMLELAGLQRFRSGINLSGDSKDFAEDLVRQVRNYGFLPERPRYHALGALLCYLLTLDDFPPDQAPFIENLIIRYSLVHDPDYIAGLRSDHQMTSAVEQLPSNVQSLSTFTPASPKEKTFASHIPEMGTHFLERQDRAYLINITDAAISSVSNVNGIKNLLRGKLPDPQINRINFRDGSRNIAEEIIGKLESRGALNPPHFHALGAFLKDLIEDDLVSYDAAVKIVVLLFRYILVTERKQIEKLSAQFQVPSFLLSEEQLTAHPFSLGYPPRNMKIIDLQERLESLYNRRRYLLDVNFLSQGAKAASAVCRIDFNKRGEGTGFLVAPDLILTNYHVMIPPGYKGDPNVRARTCEVRFGVIEGVSAGTHFTLNGTKWLIEHSRPEELDFMLLKLNRAVTDNEYVQPLPLEPHFIQADEFVNIIQHPNGGSMEVSLRFNEIVAVEEKRIYYLADTEEGSSGAPVFDDSWRVVALHHSGGIVDKAGNIVVAANIGVPINPIRERIAAHLSK